MMWVGCLTMIFKQDFDTQEVAVGTVASKLVCPPCGFVFDSHIEAGIIYKFNYGSRNY